MTKRKTSTDSAISDESAERRAIETTAARDDVHTESDLRVDAADMEDSQGPSDIWEQHNVTGTELARRVVGRIAGQPMPVSTSSERSSDRRRRSRGRRHGDEGRVEPQSLSSVLDGVVAQRGWRKEISVRSLLDNWANLVGENNAAHTEVESFHDGIVEIRADSTVWATSMRSIASQVVAKLNAELGEGTVRRIQVKGPAAPSWKHGRRSVRGRGPRDTYG